MYDSPLLIPAHVDFMQYVPSYGLVVVTTHGYAEPVLSKLACEKSPVSKSTNNSAGSHDHVTLATVSSSLSSATT